MEYFERNLAVLARSQPELAVILKSTPLRRIELAPARKGPPTGFYLRPAGDPVPLHSRYDPREEARRFLKEYDLAEADYFIFLGFGLGYGLDALLEIVAQDSAHIFVVESDLEILRAAFAARDLTSLLARPNLHFAWPPAGNELSRQWERFFDPVQARKSVYISHPPSLVIAPSLFKSAAEIIKSKTLQIFADINTLVDRSQRFLDNFTANFACASVAPGIGSFAHRFAGVASILVAAGPSLDRNIHELRSFQNRALILAADTALKPLLAAGVEPHFVLTGDPGYENYRHLEDAVTHKTHLVAEATTYPDSLTAFAGRTIVCTFVNSSLRAFSELFASKGALQAWGSVATMCLDFALRMGCDPIIFVGQDLAFSEGRTYCSGLHWEQQWFAGVQSPEQWERIWADLCAANKIVMTEDLWGRPVASTDKLLSYWNWITAEVEKHPEVRFVNATEGGILKDRVEIMSLRDALHRFCCTERDFHSEIRSLYADAARTEPHMDLAILARLRAESNQLQGILERGFALCREADSGSPAPEWSVRLDRARQSVYQLTNLAPLLDCFNQMGNVSFLRQHRALVSKPGSRPAPQELRAIYFELFQSLANAAKILAEALSRLPRV